MAERQRRLQVTFDCAQPVALATFWAAVLGYPPPDVDGFREWLRAHDQPESDAERWCRIVDPTGAWPRLLFQQVPESKVVKNRVHLDVSAPSTRAGGERRADVDAEVDRLVGLGATKLRSVVDESGYFVVLADPEGNEFCID
jgi:hypothetical protein